MAKRGRKPQFNAKECDDIRDTYNQPRESVSTTARLYKTSNATVLKIIGGTYTPNDAAEEPIKRFKYVIDVCFGGCFALFPDDTVRKFENVEECRTAILADHSKKRPGPNAVIVSTVEWQFRDHQLKEKFTAELSQTRRAKPAAASEPHIVSDPNTPEAKAFSEEYWSQREQIKP